MKEVDFYLDLEIFQHSHVFDWEDYAVCILKGKKMKFEGKFRYA